MSSDPFIRINYLLWITAFAVIMFLIGRILIQMILDTMYVKIDESVVILSIFHNEKIFSLVHCCVLEKVIDSNGSVIEVIVRSKRENLRLWGFDNMDLLWELLSSSITNSAYCITKRKQLSFETVFLIPGTIRLVGILVLFWLVFALFNKYAGQYAQAIFLFVSLLLGSIISNIGFLRNYKNGLISRSIFSVYAVSSVMLVLTAGFYIFYIFFLQLYIQSLLP